MATFRLRGGCCQLIQHFNNLPDLNLTTPLINPTIYPRIITDEEIELNKLRRTFSNRPTRYCRECYRRTNHYDVGNHKYCSICEGVFIKGLVSMV